MGPYVLLVVITLAVFGIFVLLIRWVKKSKPPKHITYSDPFWGRKMWWSILLGGVTMATSVWRSNLMTDLKYSNGGFMPFLFIGIMFAVGVGVCAILVSMRIMRSAITIRSIFQRWLLLLIAFVILIMILF